MNLPDGSQTIDYYHIVSPIRRGYAIFLEQPDPYRDIPRNIPFITKDGITPEIYAHNWSAMKYGMAKASSAEKPKVVWVEVAVSIDYKEL